jgi:hypothetical protein
VGRTCSARGFTVLSDALKTQRRGFAIKGLGQCRRLKSAELLVGLLAGARAGNAGNGAEAETIASAMGALGSSWAWRALAAREGKARAAEGDKVRALLGEALVRNYGRVSGAVRARHREAISMVELPNLRKVVTRHRASLDASRQAELEAIAARAERRR